MTTIDNKLNFVLSDLEGVKTVVEDIMAVTKNSTIPLGLKKILHETLKCRICLSAPIVPPVVITKWYCLNVSSVLMDGTEEMMH